METERGVMRKTGIYSGRLNGVSAMAAFDSPPGSSHSAVALETAQEPQKGMACLLALQSGNVSRGNESGRFVGADLYSVMISRYLPHIHTHTHTHIHTHCTQTN